MKEFSQSFEEKVRSQTPNNESNNSNSENSEEPE